MFHAPKIQKPKGAKPHAKTRLEKIASYDEQIAQLNNRKKQEMQKQKQQERKDRTRRLCQRMGLIESVLPDTIPLTDEQFKTFLERAVANQYGRDILAKIIAQSNAQATQQGAATTAQNNQPNAAKPVETKQDGTTTGMRDRAMAQG